MGFGFNLVMISIVFPLTLVLLLIWIFSKKKMVGIILAVIWGGIFGLILLSICLKPFFSKMKLSLVDYHGEYVIDRDYFSGVQADWQYSHFRFVITEDDSILFHVTDSERIVKTYRGTVSTTDEHDYDSARLKLHMDEPIHHIVQNNPTTYRDVWDFYLVFNSSEYHNMFFKKGDWLPIGRDM